ncbi:GNAT family N-acetyltransferase [Arenimonas daejeonensis]|uniref:GNAT family N-acetyltransferase n=1 Tax=Arenimonas daejeonensis TaxID=370777 RepID=UPI0013157FBE|nr:GNAT family N-acetyltransferase [Arenimonas daejeonensis]
MFTAVRPRVSERRPLSRFGTVAPDRRGALIEVVTGGAALMAADHLLGDFARGLATLFADVPGLAAQILRTDSWGNADGAVLPEYRDPDGALLLARCLGQPIGIVGIQALPGMPDTAELKRLYVHRGFRGEGFARQLLARAIGDARRLGYREIRLETSERMGDALRLYRLAGFRTVPSYRERPAEIDRHYLSLSLDLG